MTKVDCIGAQDLLALMYTDI